MCNCKKPSCNQCANDEAKSVAQLQNQVAELQDTVNQISEAAKFLMCGHPILMLQEADDIQAFDPTTGAGSKCWEGWALCIGKTHKSSSGKNITTPNLIEKFVVGAGGAYAVNDTGGEASHVLTVNEMPSHNHAVNDPGHTHVINDPGHDHGVTDPGHSHSAGSHTHNFTTGDSGNHTHDVAVGNQGTGQRSGGETDTATSGETTFTTTAGGNHNHTGTTDPAGGIDINPAFTGIDINPAFTGVSNEPADTDITLGDTGGGHAHENRPPYYALCFAMRIG